MKLKTTGLLASSKAVLCCSSFALFSCVCSSMIYRVTLSKGWISKDTDCCCGDERQLFFLWCDCLLIGSSEGTARMTQHCVWRLMSLFLSSLTSPVSQSSSIFPPCHPETETEPCVSPEMEPDPVAKCSQETEKQIAQIRAVSLSLALTLAKYHRSYLYCQEREHFSTNWEWPQHKQRGECCIRQTYSRNHEKGP